MLDVTTGSIVRQIKVGGEPEGVDISPDGKMVYVTSENDNQVYAIDTARLEVAKVIDVGPRPRSTAVLPKTHRAYVSSENGAAVHIFDTANYKVVQRLIFTPDTLRPMGVVAAPDGATVYVTTGRGGTLEAIDAATNKVRASVPVGERPWGLAVAADGKTIYTANGPSNDVSFVDAATMQVVTR